MFFPAHLGTPWYFPLNFTAAFTPSKGRYTVAENLGLKHPSKILCQGTSCRNGGPEPTHSILEGGLWKQEQVTTLIPYPQWHLHVSEILGNRAAPEMSGGTSGSEPLTVYFYLYIHQKNPY